MKNILLFENFQEVSNFEITEEVLESVLIDLAFNAELTESEDEELLDFLLDESTDASRTFKKRMNFNRGKDLNVKSWGGTHDNETGKSIFHKTDYAGNTTKRSGATIDAERRLDIKKRLAERKAKLDASKIKPTSTEIKKAKNLKKLKKGGLIAAGAAAVGTAAYLLAKKRKAAKNESFEMDLDLKLFLMESYNDFDNTIQYDTEIVELIKNKVETLLNTEE